MSEQIRALDYGRPPGGPPSSLVLIVEDDPVILTLVSEALRDEGYEVATAVDGADALETIARRRSAGAAGPDLIVLDMRMPVMDGWAFMREYRRTPAPHAPVVVITAAHESIDPAEDLGAAAVLAKPFDLDDLLAAARECLHQGAEPAGCG